jgi:hypothetical protein
MAIFTATALGAGPQVGTPDRAGATADPDGPTAIEQALIEHACSATRTAGAPENDAYQQCLSAQLLSLRADLGRDLSGLSGSERRTLDSVCSDIRAAGRREAYLECLSARLTSLRDRRKSVTPAPSQGTALPPSPVSAPSAGPAPRARRTSSWSSALWIGATLVTLFAAVGGVLLAVKGKARRVPRKCRVCGGEIPESGGLCQTCRHEAADAVRSAAIERADQQRTQAGAPSAAAALGWREVQQRQQSALEEDGRQKALQEEEEAARLRQEGDARQREEDAREREQARQRQEEEARQRVVSEEVFDPYAVLGVPHGASRDAIGAAYQKAKLKYDPDQVAHLSAEVQAHYRAKAEAVDRAHQKLTE